MYKTNTAVTAKTARVGKIKIMGDHIDISGNLDFLNLADLIQLLGSNNGTGVLRIMSKYAQEPGIIYFHKGNASEATCGTKSSIEALYSLFGWIDGKFEFTREDVTVKKTINKNRMQIILDGLRMLDDGEIEKLGPVSFEKKSSGTSELRLPLIKGPLVDYMYVVDEEDFYDGEDIVSEGNHGSWVWVLLEGVVEIMKETPKGRLKMFRIGDGSFIGSITSLFSANSIRNVTAAAVGNVQLGMIDSQQFSNEFSRLSNDFKAFIKSIDNRLNCVTNLAVDIYLKKNITEEYIKERKILIKQGDAEEKLFKVTNGNITVARKVDEAFVPISQLTRGDYFGQIPFLNIGQEPFSAFVLAEKGFKVKNVDIHSFQDEYEQLSNTFKNFLENLATCISVSSMIACDFHKQNIKKK